MAAEELSRYGWNEYWSTVLAEIVEQKAQSDAVRPGRVVRHHGVAVSVVTADGVESVPLRRGLDVVPLVGDWVAILHGTLLAVLSRTSLLERRATRREASHPLVANVDQVLVTCGLDRPLNPGRIRRCVTIAWNAGATPVIILTKADLWNENSPLEGVAKQLATEHPGLDILATSSVTGVGLDETRTSIGRGTAALLGESGSGKSSLVNALSGEQVAGTGAVRSRDRKGRHTTTTRELHPLPGGGVVVDTPGLRSIGMWTGTEAVDTTFEDITELAADCRFHDCAHMTEPGCAVQAAVEENRLDPARLEAFLALQQEAADSVHPRRSS